MMRRALIPLAAMLALGACGPMLNPTVLHDAQGS